MTDLPDPIAVDALLFDMDGTIVNSIRAAEQVWTAWALSHRIDPAKLLPKLHGVQAVDTIRRLNLPGLSPEAEAARIAEMEIACAALTRPIAGAAAFLSALPVARWAVVTSAPRQLAISRMHAAGLPHPCVLVAAEDVPCGKPAPDAFEHAADLMKTTAPCCLVLEDSPAGIQAAEAAGASILVVTATHEGQMRQPHPSIRDFHDIVLERQPDDRMLLRTGPQPCGAARLAWTLSDRG